MGVATFKSDYGEGLPPDARMADGKTGRQWHNAYPLLYNRAVWEVIHEERGEAIVFGRSGYAGSQRYPLNWTGDAQTTWDGMAGALRAGLSLSDSGIPFWCHDIGGFFRSTPEEHETAGPPDPVLYIRWAQFGLFSSHSRFHGVRGREPWWYGDEAVEIVRRYARLRYRMLPYIWAAAREATETALPVVRPMHLAFPHDPGAASIETQYMFGPSLLVAPVLNPEGRVRVYLPAGEVWYDFWTNERVEGGRWLHLSVPLDTLPLYVRGDAIVAFGPEMEHTGQKRWEPLELRVWCEREAQARVGGEGVDVRARAVRRGDAIEVALEGRGHVEIEVRAPAAGEGRVERGSGRAAGRGRVAVELDGGATVRFATV
jgi:alpha-D-xyloside xylohydrolase